MNELEKLIIEELSCTDDYILLSEMSESLYSHSIDEIETTIESLIEQNKIRVVACIPDEYEEIDTDSTGWCRGYYLNV